MRLRSSSSRAVIASSLTIATILSITTGWRGAGLEVEAVAARTDMGVAASAPNSAPNAKRCRTKSRKKDFLGGCKRSLAIRNVRVADYWSTGVEPSIPADVTSQNVQRIRADA